MGLFKNTSPPMTFITKGPIPIFQPKKGGK